MQQQIKELNVLAELPMLKGWQTLKEWRTQKELKGGVADSKDIEEAQDTERGADFELWHSETSGINWESDQNWNMENIELDAASFCSKKIKELQF